jgi:hypothetical protein
LLCVAIPNGLLWLLFLCCVFMLFAALPNCVLGFQTSAVSPNCVVFSTCVLHCGSPTCDTLGFSGRHLRYSLQAAWPTAWSALQLLLAPAATHQASTAQRNLKQLLWGAVRAGGPEEAMELALPALCKAAAADDAFQVRLLFIVLLQSESSPSGAKLNPLPFKEEQI